MKLEEFIKKMTGKDAIFTGEGEGFVIGCRKPEPEEPDVLDELFNKITGELKEEIDKRESISIIDRLTDCMTGMESLFTKLDDASDKEGKDSDREVARMVYYKLAKLRLYFAGKLSL